MRGTLSELEGLLPRNRAMTGLLPQEPTLLPAQVQPLLAGVSPEVAAGVWLYVDDLDRSHQISQSLDTPTGAFLHAIMHRREGDFWNSKYWYRRAQGHPAMTGDPFSFVDEVERRHTGNPEDLVSLQRQEWHTLMEWCLRATD